MGLAEKLEKADEDHRKSRHAAIDAYNRASEQAKQTYLQSIRKAEAECRHALEPVEQAFKEALHKSLVPIEHTADEAIRKADQEYQAAIQPIIKTFKQALLKGDQELQNKMGW